MKVENITDRHFVKLKELNVGDCFVYDEDLYLMLALNLTGTYSTVNLNENRIRTFEYSNLEVEKVSAKVVIEG